jgi:hypothetical protein
VSSKKKDALLTELEKAGVVGSAVVGQVIGASEGQIKAVP